MYVLDRDECEGWITEWQVDSRGKIIVDCCTREATCESSNFVDATVGGVHIGTVNGTNDGLCLINANGWKAIHWE